MSLESLARLPLDPMVKGVPLSTPSIELRAIANQGWNLLRGDLPMPVAIIKRSALENNSRWMRRFLELTDARIAPHGKTTMCPQLFQRQLDDGAWGLTVATVQQLLVARAHGVPRVILANQLIGRQEIGAVLAELKRDGNFDFYCLVDSIDGVRRLADEAGRHSPERPVQVLLEGGFAGGRTGCRTRAEAILVAEEVQRCAPHLALRGVEGFEGLIGGNTAAEQDASISAFIDGLVAIAGACAERGLFAPGPIIMTAGGSAFFDFAATRLHNALAGKNIEVVIRSGCYLTHDSKSYRDLVARLMERLPAAKALGDGLRPALQVWAYVQSRPERGRAIATLGKRDVGFDVTLPVIEQWYRAGLHDRPQPIGDGHAVVELNDQHAHIEIPASSPLEVGDLVSFGVSHPCTTFDRWQLLYEVDDDYNVIGGLKTFF